MSGDMDKFVLQYSVEMKDAIVRLEQLNEKVVKVKETADKGKGGFTKFGTEITDELGKILPGFDKVSSAVKAMSSDFIIAGAVVAALAVGVKSVMDLRTQFGQQRVDSRETGISSLRMEDIQRKFAKNSDGNVSRETAADQVKNLSGMFTAAYTDPTRVGRENIMMRMAGVDVPKLGQPPRPFNDSFTQLASNFSKMSPEQAQGTAKAMGINQDFAAVMQKLGASVGRVTELTENDILQRQKAEESLKKFNDEMALFDTNVNNLKISLGEHLLPVFTHLITIIEKIVSLIPSEKVEKKVDQNVNYVTGGEKSTGSFWQEWKNHLIGGGGPVGALYRAYVKPKLWDGNKSYSDVDKLNGSELLAKKSTSVAIDKNYIGNKEISSSLDRAVENADKNNETTAQSAADMVLAANMFNGAVSTFANAIDDRQAWAAWAGDVGAAGGMSVAQGTLVATDGKGHATGSNGLYQNTSIAATKYENDYDDAQKKYGVDKSLLKNVTRTESNFNPNAKSNQGAIGLMQVLQSNAKGKDLTDPRTNIMEGAKLLAQYLKDAHGDVRTALMMYHGGYDKKGWGPLTQAYPDKVLGARAANGQSTPSDKYIGGGATRADMQIRNIQENISGRLGVPVQQVMIGGIRSGDASWSLAQKKAEVSNQIFTLQKELMQANMPQTQRSKIINEVRQQQSDLNIMNKYGDKVTGMQSPGDRTITIGERAVQINVNGAQDPHQTSLIMEQRLNNELGDIVNSASSGIKY